MQFMIWVTQGENHQPICGNDGNPLVWNEILPFEQAKFVSRKISNYIISIIDENGSIIIDFQ